MTANRIGITLKDLETHVVFFKKENALLPPEKLGRIQLY